MSQCLCMEDLMLLLLQILLAISFSAARRGAVKALTENSMYEKWHCFLNCNSGEEFRCLSSNLCKVTSYSYIVKVCKTFSCCYHS